MFKKLLWPLIILVVSVAAILIFFREQISPAVLPETEVPDIEVLGEQDEREAMPQSYALNGRRPEINSEDVIIGSPTAPLKIFVYEDYSDVYSARLASTFEKIEAEHYGRLVFVFRPYAAATELARVSALAVDCSLEQDKWKEMRALLFARAESGGLSKENLDSYADQIGLDKQAFDNCLTKKEKSEKIEQDALLAASYGVIGTPTSFIGDEVVLGARPYEDFTDSSGDRIEGLKAMVAKKLAE